ncbi:MAG: DUF4301 family protein [Bacteroidales bacterium]|nr:DUF4301 family protein [Bacteroidales bacterium]
MDNNFSEKDLQIMKERNISPSLLDKQIQNYKTGFPFVALSNPATVKNGITQLSTKKMDEMVSVFEDFAAENKIIKIVPASGAASRMFKNLMEFRNAYRGTADDQLELLKDKGPDSVYYFFEHLEDFAFFNDLIAALENRGHDYETTMKEVRYERILNSLLTNKGLAYGSKPKALIPFHKYSNEIRTSFAEHLAEGAKYARSAGNTCHIQFTVSPQHLDMMKEHFLELKELYEERNNIRYEVNFSIQAPETDIIAVDMDNKALRDENGELVFRPGGHGALLKNLDDLDAPLIIIKNIDNVCHERVNNDTYYYKMLLSGYLVHIQEQVHSYLKGLDHPTLPSTKVVSHMWSFMEKKLNVIPPEESSSWNKERKISFIKEKFNRPIRVCGMVENEGEPGGGPFWVKNSDGSLTLQIIESSQIDLKDEEQVAILNNSTHFNPVDLICGIYDYQGNKFDLQDFVDRNTGFISTKSLEGQEIKSQELPGLWNGSMSNWITIFIEVPLLTFNPVKMVNDLLRSQHIDMS